MLPIIVESLKTGFFMSLSVQSGIGFSKYIVHSAEEQISENKNVKNLIKNIDKLDNAFCCRSCNTNDFHEIKNSLVLVDQKPQQVINQTNQAGQKYLSPQKQEVLFDRSIQQLVSSGEFLKRKIESPPQKCLRGPVKAAPVRMGSFVIDRANRIVSVFPAAGRSLCIGILAGCVMQVVTIAVFSGINYFYPFPSDAGSEYGRMLDRISLFDIAIKIPLIEELIFRGIIQRSVSRITKSPRTGIGVSAALFGAVHLINPHKLRVLQATIAGLGGVALGMLNHQLGFAASFGAHAANNFLSMTL